MNAVKTVLAVVCAAAALGASARGRRFVVGDESQGHLRYFDEDHPENNFSVAATRPVWDLKKIGKWRYRVIGANGFEVIDLRERKIVETFRHGAAGGVSAVCDLPGGDFVCVCGAGKDIRLARFGKDRKLKATYIYRGINNPRKARTVSENEIVTSHDHGFARLELPAAPGEKPETPVEGRIIQDFKMPREHNAYDMARTLDGKGWWLSCGYGRQLIRFADDGTAVSTWEPKFKDGKNGHYFAQIDERPDGHVYLANWNGHGREDGRGNWQVVELDEKGEVVWHFHAPHCGSFTGFVFEDEPPPFRGNLPLARFPDSCVTPDSMAVDSKDRLVVTAPNFADTSKRGALFRIDNPGDAPYKWVDLPEDPETKRVSPMGIALGPKDEVYVVDNQGWTGEELTKNRGRVLRVIVKDNKVQEWNVIASGFEHPNGIRLHNGRLYVTASSISGIKDPSGMLTSGVYRFDPAERDVKISNSKEDRNLLLTFTTKNRFCQYGLDGICFDRKGDMYVGNFGDGEVFRVPMDADGRPGEPVSFAKTKFDTSIDPAKEPDFLKKAVNFPMRTTDGMCFGPDGWLYVADFSNNAVVKVSPDGRRIEFVRRDDDGRARDGALNQPGEPVFWRGRLVASNFDMVCGPDKVNSKRDPGATLTEVFCIRDMLSAEQLQASRPVVEALLGRAFTEGEESKTDRELWRIVAAKDELLADWICQDEELPARVTPLSVDDPVGRLEAAFRKAGVKDGGDLKARLARYREACLARRARRLADAAAEAPKWVYARHYVMGGSHYAYTEAQSDGRAERVFHERKSQLCMIEAQPDGFWKETVLLETDKGCFRDVDVSLDGKRLLYAYKASNRGDDFHLYEMDLATRKVTQLTFAKGFADYEGCYLPNGQIMFNSTRPVQVVDCWWTEVSNIYRCERDGTGIARMTYDQVHDNFPTLSWDGRVLYTRWEYSDRSQMFPQPLFAMEWDGSNQRAVYGDNSWYPTTIIHARAVPGSPMIFAIATGHHTTQAGDLIRIDPREGRQENEGVSQIGPLRRAEWERVDVSGQAERVALYPYPLSERELFASMLPEGWPYNRRPGDNRPDYRAVFEPFGLYWTDVDGARELLAPSLGGRPPCGRMVPVRPRTSVPLRHTMVDASRKTGSFFVQDVYEGEAMAGVKRGTVKKLRVIGLDYRPAGIGRNGNGGPGGSATVSTPVAICNGTWDPKVVVGDADVEEDGSVYFKAPVHMPIYFMLLDEKGRMVQSMRSWTMLMPGESASCTGCHENKNGAPPSANVRAAASLKPVQKLTPILDKVRGFSFRRDVEPIINQRCAKCHAAGSTDKPDLSNTPVVDSVAKRRWTRAYLSLTHSRANRNAAGEEIEWRGDNNHKVVKWISAASEPTLLKPLAYGSNASELFSKRLDAGHCPDLTDAELRRLAMWVDLCVPYCGDYEEESVWTDEERETYRTLVAKRKTGLLDPRPDGK